MATIYCCVECEKHKKKFGWEFEMDMDGKVKEIRLFKGTEPAVTINLEGYDPAVFVHEAAIEDFAKINET